MNIRFQDAANEDQDEDMSEEDSEHSEYNGK